MKLNAEYSLDFIETPGLYSTYFKMQFSQYDIPVNISHNVDIYYIVAMYSATTSILSRWVENLSLSFNPGSIGYRFIKKWQVDKVNMVIYTIAGSTELQEEVVYFNIAMDWDSLSLLNEELFNIVCNFKGN